MYFLYSDEKKSFGIVWVYQVDIVNYPSLSNRPSENVSLIYSWRDLVLGPFDIGQIGNRCIVASGSISITLYRLPIAIWWYEIIQFYWWSCEHQVREQAHSNFCSCNMMLWIWDSMIWWLKKIKGLHPLPHNPYIMSYSINKCQHLIVQTSHICC